MHRCTCGRLIPKTQSVCAVCLDIQELLEWFQHNPIR